LQSDCSNRKSVRQAYDDQYPKRAYRLCWSTGGHGRSSKNLATDEFLRGVIELDATTNDSAQLFETLIANHGANDASLHNRWLNSHGLVTMFSKGLQKNAKRLQDS
jgi:hypothetical protein